MPDELNKMLLELAKAGCYPSIYYRGRQTPWRAHINRAGNFWADGADMLEALREAHRQWELAGWPMDGAADIPEVIKDA